MLSFVLLWLGEILGFMKDRPGIGYMSVSQSFEL